MGVICWYSKRQSSLLQPQPFSFGLAIHVPSWIDTAWRHKASISNNGRKYARVPIYLFAYWHLHVQRVFPDNFPGRIWVSVGFTIHLDPQSRYYSACCYPEALPSCSELKTISEDTGVYWSQMHLKEPQHAKYSHMEMCSWDLHFCWLRDLCLETPSFLMGSHFWWVLLNKCPKGYDPMKGLITQVCCEPVTDLSHILVLLQHMSLSLV